MMILNQGAVLPTAGYLAVSRDSLDYPTLGVGWEGRDLLLATSS